MTKLPQKRPAAALDLGQATNEQLRAELARSIELTAHHLARAAEIWTELNRRGVDVSQIKAGLALYLPRIAQGKLAAEAVVAFAGQRMLLQHMVGMPLEQQRKYAAGEPITVAARDDDGQIIGSERRLSELSAREVILAIADGRVRPMKAQSESLMRQVTRTVPRRAKTGSVARVRADKAAGTIQIGRVRLEPLDLASALRTLGFDLVRRANV